MPGSVAVDTFRVEQWEHDAVTGEDSRDKSEQIGERAPIAAGGRTPPWPRRRLNDALADLGPARPETSAGPVGSGTPRHDLPPPQKPVRRSSPSIQADVPPAASEPAAPSWETAGLADVDTAGADIIRALASANMPGDGADEADAFAGSAMPNAEDLERPPMIIERALAEQGLGALAVMAASGRRNPLPGLTVGFSLSLLAGAILYMVLAAG